MEWDLPLPFTVPLSMNDSSPMSKVGRMMRADRVKAFRHASFVLAQHAGIPALQRFTVVLNWRPPTNRRRDVENYFATVKPCVDGIVDAGVAPDDTPEYYVSSTPVLHAAIKGDPGRMWLTVIDLSDTTPTEVTVKGISR
jgi:crossover junction endodeoxyribonuclease RusA